MDKQSKCDAVMAKLLARADTLTLDSFEADVEQSNVAAFSSIIAEHFKVNATVAVEVYTTFSNVFAMTKCKPFVMPECLREDVLASLMSLEEKPTDPIGHVFEMAQRTDFCNTKILCSKSSLGIFNNQHVSVRRIVDTALTASVKNFLWRTKTDGATDADATVVVCGPSGSGKTTSVITLSGAHHNAIVAELALAEDLAVPVLEDVYTKRCALANVLKACENLPSGEQARQRNEEVLRLVAEELCYVVPQQVLVMMDTIPKDKAFRFIVFLDQVGGEMFMPAVRALCALTGNQVKEALCKRLKEAKDVEVNLSNIIFELCVAGTGIDTHELAVGSQPGSYKLIFAYTGSAGDDEAQRHERSNREVFGSHFKGLDVEGLKPHLHPFFWRMISENTRMAAILGADINRWLASISFANDEERGNFFKTFDCTQFLGPAYFQFKGLNGLCQVRPCDALTILFKVLRMHWFPGALTVDADRMQTKYGLIVDRLPADAKAVYSPKLFPFFTTGLLAMLSGCSVVTRSLMSGAPLEEYTTVVMHMLACAANNEKLFLLALQHNDGCLVPMRADAPLPSQHDREFKCLIHQMGAYLDNAQGTTGSENNIVDSAKRLFSTFTTTSTTATAAVNRDYLHIASIRMFDNAPFADSMLFIGSHGFLFQVKDLKDGSNIQNVEDEREKMTGSRGARRILQGTVKAWYAATGTKITHIYRVFVTPTPRKAPAGGTGRKRVPIKVTAENGISWQVAVASDDLYVSVNEIRFLPFDAVRRRAAPLLFGTPQTIRISKSGPKTPELVKAPDVVSPSRAAGSKRPRSRSNVD